MTVKLAELGLLEDEEIELDLAALTLSALDHDGIELEPYYALLDEIEERLALVGADALTLEQQAEALAQVFGTEYGFIGDAEAYGAPINADLIRVLERKQGLPVSLSILYVSAARRMGWTAYALNTPGHVLVRIGDERFILIDPFKGGTPVSKDQLAAMIREFMGSEAQLQPEYLHPVPNRAILVRLLRNQALRAEQAGDRDRAVSLHVRMTQIAPEYPDVWWEMAGMQVQQRNVEGARDSLSAMLEVTRDPDRRKSITAALDQLSGRSGQQAQD
ncbi:MAG: transglutaminase-like domain-containing protein [Sphingomonadaceae bacterium]|nr:transglutaminase-like domain-containing protein [Sphingomonadaceae bacterium]